MLYIVSTPIGNLADITQRAVETLEQVDLIAAEDTRHSRRLLSHLGISKQMISLHEHNEMQRLQPLIEKMQNGQSIALISDAGTPTISDPGSLFVKACIEAKIPVVPVPGASALLAAYSASGIVAQGFTFLGFLPPKAAERKEKMQWIKNHPLPVILYESPHRIQTTLKELYQILENRACFIARELTKVYETHYNTTLQDAIESIETPRGEYVIIISPAEEQAHASNVKAVDGHALMQQLLDAGLKRKQAAEITASVSNLSKNEAYQIEL